MEREYGEAMRWFGSDRLSLGGGYAFRHLHFTQALDHGYFDPGQYRSHLGAGGVRFALGKVYRFEALGYLSKEQINQGNYTGAGKSEYITSSSFIAGSLRAAIRTIDWCRAGRVSGRHGIASVGY